MAFFKSFSVLFNGNSIYQDKRDMSKSKFLMRQRDTRIRTSVLDASDERRTVRAITSSLESLSVMIW